MILKPSEIKQPVGGLVHEPPHPKDWVKDDPTLGVTHPVLCPSKDWTPYITEYELQRNGIFDPYDCVTQGLWNQIQCLAKLQGVKLDESKRYTAVKSGTKPRQGNSLRAVAESIRTQGCVAEKDYVTMTPSMTEQEFFQEIPPQIDILENFLKGWSYTHENLPVSWLGVTMESLIEDALKYSPVAVAIEGSYTFDSQDRLQYVGNPYNHVVLVVKSQPDCFIVLDSENPQGLMKVRRDYSFSSPKVGYIEKKNMNQLIKEDGSPAVYLQLASGELFGISDSPDITGGDLLKVCSGSYGNAGIKHVPSGTLDKSKVVGTVAAHRNVTLSSIFNL